MYASQTTHATIWILRQIRHHIWRARIAAEWAHALDVEGNRAGADMARADFARANERLAQLRAELRSA